jgi:hypothetical protein
MPRQAVSPYQQQRQKKEIGQNRHVLPDAKPSVKGDSGQVDERWVISVLVVKSEATEPILRKR